MRSMSPTTTEHLRGHILPHIQPAAPESASNRPRPIPRAPILAGAVVGLAASMVGAQEQGRQGEERAHRASQVVGVAKSRTAATVRVPPFGACVILACPA